MSQFYLSGDWGQSSQANLMVKINGDLAHHLRVRRIDPSESFTVFDGLGTSAKARLVTLLKHSGEIELSDIRLDLHRESHYRIELIQGLAGGDKMDWIIEKAVEIGATSITPVECERSILRLLGDSKRSEKRLGHWQALTRAACEQCDRTIIPSIDAIQGFEQALSNTKGKLKVLLSPEVTDSFESFLNQQVPQDISLLIGPEGGCSPAEVALAQEAGFEILAMGPRTLRTETAGIVAITAVNTIWNLKLR